MDSSNQLFNLPTYEEHLFDELCRLYLNNGFAIISATPVEPIMSSTCNGSFFQIVLANFTLRHFNTPLSNVQFIDEYVSPVYGPLIVMVYYDTDQLPVHAAQEIFTKGGVLTPFYGENTYFSEHFCSETSDMEINQPGNASKRQNDTEINEPVSKKTRLN
jgi:hypothetical protein